MKKYAFPLLLLIACAAAVTMTGSAVANGQCCVKNDQGACVPCPTSASTTATSATLVVEKPAAACQPSACSVRSAGCSAGAKSTGVFKTAFKVRVVNASAVNATAINATCSKAGAAACNSSAQCDGKVCVPCDPEDCELSCEKSASPPEGSI